jgi:hypothetical protein
VRASARARERGEFERERERERERESLRERERERERGREREMRHMSGVASHRAILLRLLKDDLEELRAMAWQADKP